MPNHSPLRVAIVGAGAISQTHAAAIERSAAATLAAVCDAHYPAAEALAAPFQAKACRGLEELISLDGFDAAIVCTPPDSHPEICVELLERGIHVLCEKPIAIGRDAAEKMFYVAQQSGALLTMASKFRHCDDIRRAKSLVQSDVIGEVILFENSFTSNVDMRTRWNSNPEVSGGGVLIDNGTHSVDIMRYFLGPLEELRVIEGKRMQTPAVEDTVKIFVRSCDGVLGDIDLSWSINKELPNYVNLYGTRGTIQVGWKESRFRRSQDSGWTVFGTGYNKIQAFVDQLENFVAAIHGEAELEVKPVDARASVAVVDTAYAAMRDSHWHRIGDSATRSVAEVDA